MRPRAVVLLALALVGLSASARAQEPLHYGLRLEAGAEQDSNPARLETIQGLGSPRPIVASPLARVVTSATLLARLAERHALSLAGGLGAKRFLRPEAQPEDVMVAEASGSYNVLFGSATGLGLGGAYYEIFQRAETVAEARDYRSVSPTLRLDQRIGPARLSAGAGYRWLLFKPQRDFDFVGPSGFLRYQQAALAAPGEDAADWEWGLGASLEARRFASGRCQTLEDCPPSTSAPVRQDRFAVIDAEVTRTGDVLLGAGAALHVVSSNSYGESLTRVVGTLRGVFPLAWQISLAARAELVATGYRQKVPVGHNPVSDMFVRIDEESRSTLRIDLARPLGSAAEVGVRYTFYTNAFRAGPVEFQRHTLLGYLALVLER
jgi:hypothetical protein